MHVKILVQGQNECITIAPRWGRSFASTRRSLVRVASGGSTIGGTGGSLPWRPRHARWQVHWSCKWGLSRRPDLRTQQRAEPASVRNRCSMRCSRLVTKWSSESTRKVFASAFRQTMNTFLMFSCGKSKPENGTKLVFLHQLSENIQNKLKQQNVMCPTLFLSFVTAADIPERQKAKPTKCHSCTHRMDQRKWAGVNSVKQQTENGT